MLRKSVVVAVLLALILAVVLSQNVVAEEAACTQESALAAEGLAWRLRTEVVESGVLVQNVSTDKYWWAGEAALKRKDWAKAQTSFELVSFLLIRGAVKESYQGLTVPAYFNDFASELVALQGLTLAELKPRVSRASNPPQEVKLYSGSDESLVIAYVDPGILLKFPELLLQYNLWEDEQQVTFYVESPVIRIYIQDTMGRTPSLDLFDTNWQLSKWQFLGEIGPGSVTERVFSGENYDW